MGLTSSSTEAEGAKVSGRMNEAGGEVDDLKPIAS